MLFDIIDLRTTVRRFSIYKTGIWNYNITHNTTDKRRSAVELREFFAENNKIALAFSGGTDSAYLLWAGTSCGADIRPYYVNSGFQPEWELEDAVSLCRLLGVELTVIPTDILSIDGIAANPPDRCYICKSAMLGAIKNRADADGYAVIIDGTNASDDVSDRPGMRAVRELGILSPLRICGMTKPEIRKRLSGAGLNEWDKPSYSCLATRLSQGTEITPDRLKRIEISENILRGMGLSDFRLRTDGDTARLQVKAEQAQTATELLSEIRQSLSHYYREIQLDEEHR